MQESIGADFAAKKLEYEWARSADRFTDTSTHLWFTWVEWTLVLGALLFLYRQTNNPWVFGVAGISVGLFQTYFLSLFYRFRFRGLPLIKSQLASRLMSLTLSTLLNVGTFYLLRNIIVTVAENR